MKFNYKLQRLCGAYYGNPIVTNEYGPSSKQDDGSNILYTSDGNTLISATSNRIQCLDLATHTVRTLAGVEARSNIRALALSPTNNELLVVVDTQNYAMIVNITRSVVLHRLKFKKKVYAIKFSPCGLYIGVTHGRHIQIWEAPNHMRKEFMPLILHRTYTGQSKDVTSVEFSSDSSLIMACSKDCTVRIWSVHTTKHYQPITLSGHKTPIVGAYFAYRKSNGQDGEEVEVDDTGFSSSVGVGIGVGVGSKRTRDVINSKNSSTVIIDSCYTISQDGSLVTWKCVPTNDEKSSTPKENIDLPPSTKNDDDDDIDIDQDVNTDFEAQMDDATDFFSGGSLSNKKKAKTSSSTYDNGDDDDDDDDNYENRTQTQAHSLVKCVWKYEKRHYLNGNSGGGGQGSSITTCSYNEQTKLIAIGFSSGIFGIYEMPSVSNIHTLSVGSQQIISSCALNSSGEWLAMGCPKSQQLLVWEWRSETYIIKQRGHSYGMNCFAYSPDGIVIASGGEDGKIKLWNSSSGFCYATLGSGAASTSNIGGEGSHQAPITGIVFAKPSVVLSASLDGTIKAHDLHRYRTFRTLTTPTPVQFLSLAVDPSGEIVCGGTMDPFHIYAWNLQTGKLLDVYTGHTGPISCLQFLNGGTLVSSSWDGSLKVWELYKNNVSTETLQHQSDVVCLCCSPNGKEICSGTIRGLLSFWDVESGKLKFELDGTRDISGGRKHNDRMTSKNNASSRYFTSIAYSADGSCLLAGGNSKFVCIYEISQQILLKKFQVTFNRNLDGVLDELSSKNMTDFGPIDDHANVDSEDETTYNAIRLPGAKRGDDGSRSSKVEVLTRQVAFSSTGREWSAVSGEGLHVYSLDEDMLFDPISLTEAITPAAVEMKLFNKDYSLALRMSIHLNESKLMKQVLEEIPYASIPSVVKTISQDQLERLMNTIAKIMETSPHVQYYLRWSLELLKTHGVHMDKHRSSYMRAFRSLHKIIQTKQDELLTICHQNKYTLEFIENQAQLKLTDSTTKIDVTN